MLTVDLHPYQDAALEAFLSRGNLLLALDMGLGKTITSLGAAEELLGREEIGRTLIVCPSGLKLQWAQAIATRTDVATKAIKAKDEVLEVPEDRYCVVIDGTPAQRRELYKMIDELHPEYVIVGYQTVASDLRYIKRIKPGLIVLDEATTIKNPAAGVTRAVRQLWAPWRLALTGTPIDNRLEELYHILRWVDPDVLGDFEKFDRSFIKRDFWGRVKRYVNLPILHKKVADVLFRRKATDPDVAPYMPDLYHDRWLVTMDESTARVYRRIMADLGDELGNLPARERFDLAAHYQGHSESTPAGRIMAIHICAEMLLTNPALLAESDSHYSREIVQTGAIDGLPESAKWRRLCAEVDALLADPGNKIIITSRFRRMVDCITERWPDSVAYHGGMSPRDKQAAVSRFEHDPTIRVLAMSHAGAYGVDLPAANVLINLDPARSTGQRNQIAHRHVRAGSRHDRVRVVDLITAGTIEERTYNRLDLRGRVASAAIDGSGADEIGQVVDDVTSLTEHVTTVLTGSRR